MTNLNPIDPYASYPGGLLTTTINTISAVPTDTSTTTTTTTETTTSLSTTEASASIIFSIQPAAVLPTANPGAARRGGSFNGKRQAEVPTGGFLGSSDDANPEFCTNAEQFLRSNGQLVAGNRPLSVNPGVPFIDMTNWANGSISREFSIRENVLVWTNSEFTGGVARFCQVPSGVVYALFDDGSDISDCVLVNLVGYLGE